MRSFTEFLKENQELSFSQKLSETEVFKFPDIHNIEPEKQIGWFDFPAKAAKKIELKRLEPAFQNLTLQRKLLERLGELAEQAYAAWSLRKTRGNILPSHLAKAYPNVEYDVTENKLKHFKEQEIIGGYRPQISIKELRDGENLGIFEEEKTPDGVRYNLNIKKLQENMLILKSQMLKFKEQEREIERKGQIFGDIKSKSLEILDDTLKSPGYIKNITRAQY